MFVGWGGGGGGSKQGVLYSVGKCDGDECSEKTPQVIAADKQQLPFFNFNIISSTVNKGEL